MNRQRERRIMIIMRFSMFFIGAIIGAIGMWQALTVIDIAFHPALIALFYIASSLLAGGVLFLSAPIARVIFKKISTYFRRRFKVVKAVDIAGIASGFIVGVAVALIVEFTFVLFLPILAVRILISILLGLIFAFITAIAISGWIARGIERERQDNGQEATVRHKGHKGFLLTANALAHPKILLLCNLWLEGNLFVLSQTAEELNKVNTLSGLDKQEKTNETLAYNNYKLLLYANSIKVLELFKQEVETEALIDAGEMKCLKIVCTNTDVKMLNTDKDIVFLNLDEL